jgi:hypothetical protein
VVVGLVVFAEGLIVLLLLLLFGVVLVEDGLVWVLVLAVALEWVWEILGGVLMIR